MTTPPSAVPREPLVHILPTGLKLLLRRDTAAPVVTLWAWVALGSVNETEEEAGLSHVLEHMAFKGTPARGVGEISRQVEEMGGVINAFTTNYSTAYHISLPRERLTEGLDILSDVLINSSLDPAELAKELEVVSEEIRLRDDQPETRLWELLTGLVYRRHTLGRPIGGYHEVVSRFTPEQVRAFWERHYTPADTRLVIVGDFEPTEVLPLAEQMFGGYRRRGEPPRQPEPEPEQTAPRIKVEEMPCARAHLALAWPTGGQLSPAVPALDILTSILGSGNSSRLYRRVKDELNLVDDILADLFTGDDAGLLTVEAELDPADIPAVLAAILAEVELLRREAAGEYELERVRHAVELDLLEERETVEGQAHDLAFYDQLGDWRLADCYLEQLYQVDGAGLLAAARDWLRPERLSLALIVPTGCAADLPPLELTPGQTEPPPLRRAPEAAAPPVGAVPDAAELEYRLPNGVTAVLRHTPTRPLATVIALLRGGVYEEQPEEEGVTNFSLELLTRGTLKRSAADFHAALEFYGTALDTAVQRDYYGLKLSCASRHLAPCLDLLLESLLEPSFPRAELEPMRADVLSDIATREDDMVGYTLGRANIALHGGRGYGRFLDGRAEVVRRLNELDLAAWHRARLTGNRLVLGVAGNLDLPVLRKQLERLAGGLPSGGAVPPPPAPDYRAATVEGTCSKQQTHLALAFPAPPLTDERRFAATVLAQALSGSGSRLFLELRDREHLAYLVFFLYRGLSGAGAFFAYLGTQPGRGGEALARLTEELERVRREGLSSGEVAAARQHLEGVFRLGLQRNKAALSLMLGETLVGRPAAGGFRFAERIALVSPEEVNLLAAECLSPERMTVCRLRGNQLPSRR